MVYALPPTFSTGKTTYTDAYNRILTAHRRSPATSASSVIILVAPNVDALCASRMLADLFKHDDVIYRTIPVSCIYELESLREEFRMYPDLHTLILINMGAVMDLPSETWFGSFDNRVTVHVIDSTRPQSLPTLFKEGDSGERVIVWDDGEAEKLAEEKKAWEVLQYEPEYDSDESDDDQYNQDEDQIENSDVDEDDNAGEPGRRRGKRKSTGDMNDTPRKRQRAGEQGHRVSRDELERHAQRLSKYYDAGMWHGQSASSTIYTLASILERVDNEFLWLAILGLTYQYITSRISRDTYESYQKIYYDEVSRLNTLPANAGTEAYLSISLNPDDGSVRAIEELRFTLFRHWTLYDAMFHSSYVAGKLGIWKERGRKRLTGLLAKMGFSIPQTQQPYAHMDMDLKKALVQKLDETAPEYGLVELSYPSFMRCYGYHTQPLSAADAVEGISALLDVAGGIRMEIEVEGARNGGEWFSSGKVWEVHGAEMEEAKKRTDGDNGAILEGDRAGDGTEELKLDDRKVQWWVKNFWTAYDALTNIKSLRESLNLSMSLQRAIIRQGTSIIDKQIVRTMRRHRVVLLTQGPDLALFTHPGVLERLALWLVDALRDRVPGTNVGLRSRRQTLPLVIACLQEQVGKYIVAGVMASLDFEDVRKNEFSRTFLDAIERSNANFAFRSFESAVVEIDERDLKTFLDALCEGPEGY